MSINSEARRAWLCHTCDWSGGVRSGSARGDVIFCTVKTRNFIANDVQACSEYVHGERFPDESPKEFKSRKTRDALFVNLTETVKEHETKEAHGSDSSTGDTEDRRFDRLALEEARKSIPENDGRPHPLVGAVVVKDGKVLATAHRGEVAGNHAEYIALEKKLAEIAVAGATVYTTLEPCITRNHPKIPCANRLVERKVKRVVIGMLDPDPRITGRGQRRLREANIITDLFPHDLMTEVEEMNREFNRQFESSHAATEISEKWVSLGYERKSGLAEKTDQEGFELGWVTADKETEKIEFENWEYVIVDQPNGKRARLKIHDHPAVGGYLVLLKRRKASR